MDLITYMNYDYDYLPMLDRDDYCIWSNTIDGYDTLNEAFFEGPSNYIDDSTEKYNDYLNRILELKNRGLKWCHDSLFLNILNIFNTEDIMMRIRFENNTEDILMRNIFENRKVTKQDLFEIEWIKEAGYEIPEHNNNCEKFMKKFIIRTFEWNDDMIVNINENINENILMKMKWLVKNGCKINDYNIDKFIINVIKNNDYNSKNWKIIKMIKKFGHEFKGIKNLLFFNENWTLNNIKFIFQNVNFSKYTKSYIIQRLNLKINNFIKINDIKNVIWCIENGVRYNYTAFHTAIEENNLEIMKILKKIRCEIGIYCVKKAIEHRNIDIIKWVILNAPFDYKIFIKCIDDEKTKFKENSDIMNVLNEIYNLDIDILNDEKNIYEKEKEVENEIIERNKKLNFYNKTYLIMKNEKKQYKEEDIQKLYYILTNTDYFTENQINRLKTTFEELKIKKQDLNIENLNVKDFKDFLIKITN